MSLGSYNFVGPFTAIDTGNGAWRLSRGMSADVSAEAQIMLRGAGAAATQIFADAPQIERVGLEWSRDIVIVTLTFAGGVTALTVNSAIVHEPQPNLYRCLPLVELDADARIFWKRVFRLMRIPGGRFLLGLLTRRRRQPQE